MKNSVGMSEIGNKVCNFSGLLTGNFKRERGNCFYLTASTRTKAEILELNA